MPQFYSYLWLREDRTPYYAGKGCGNRAFKTHHKENGKKLYPPKDRSRILVFPMLNEAEAIESEKGLIEMFGRKDIGSGWAAIAPCLRNFTNGGDGTSGRKYSDETRRKIAIASARTQKGRKHSPQHVEKVAQANRGKKRSPEQIAKHSAWLRGRHLTQEHKEKVGKAGIGRVPTLEALTHMSAAQAGHPPTFLGRKHTPEAIAKQSAARRIYWERRKNHAA